MSDVPSAGVTAPMTRSWVPEILAFVRLPTDFHIKMFLDLLVLHLGRTAVHDRHCLRVPNQIRLNDFVRVHGLCNDTPLGAIMVSIAGSS